MRLGTPLTFSPTLNASQGSVQLLAQNERRVALAIQNLAPSSATTDILYFSFGTDAGPNLGLALGPGKGLMLDIHCPKSALFVYMNSVSGQPLTVMEMFAVME